MQGDLQILAKESDSILIDFQMLIRRIGIDTQSMEIAVMHTPHIEPKSNTKVTKTNSSYQNAQKNFFLKNCFTKHAASRMQQRGISSIAVDLLFEFGTSLYHKGAEVMYFNHRSFTKLKENHHFKPQFLEKIKSNYLVYAGGYIITVGHHISRFKRDC